MILIRTLVLALLLLVGVVVTFAQSEQAGKSTSPTDPTVTAFTAGEPVRFTAPATVVQIRLEVYTSAGKKIFDTELRGGNVLDWHLEDGQAGRVADDTYLCVVTVKSLSGKLTQRIGLVTIQRASARLRPVDPSQMTPQQVQAVGPVEEDAGLIILNDDQQQTTTTVVAHNGEDGQITRGKGALSFRIGDFFSGKDTEQMRLTAEGNLGIGITNPQVKLDVDGLIRASHGVIFPDGSIQFSAANKTLGAKSSPPDQTAGAQQEVQPQAAATTTQNHIAKFTDNSATLGDSIVFESAGGNIGIGTSNPAKKLDVTGGQIALDNLRFFYARRTNNQFQEAFGIDSNNDIVFNRNSVGPGVDADAPKAPSALIFGTGQGRFLDVRNSSNVTMLRVDELTGFVGIGTALPASELTVRTGTGLNGVTHTDGNITVGSYVGAGPSGATGGWLGTLSDHQLHFFTNNAQPSMTINPNGNVGIGTSNPQTKLDVAGDLQVSGNIAAKYQDVAEWVLASQKLAPGTVVSLDLTRINAVVPSARAYDTHLAGIVSSQPGVILGQGGIGKLLIATVGRVKVKVDATQHPIRIGDLLVSSDQSGVAMRSRPLRLAGTLIHRPGTIIGKALEPLAKGKGEILVLLSLQ